MKKVLFSLFLFSVMAVGVQAQKSACSKSCTAKPAAGVSSCEGKSASVATTGGSDAVSYVDVNYDAATNTFVNVSPMKMEGGKDCGTKGTSANGKSCCAGKSSATSTSGSNGKSCCAGKTTATTTSTTTSGKAVKTSSSSKD